MITFALTQSVRLSRRQLQQSLVPRGCKLLRLKDGTQEGLRYVGKVEQAAAAGAASGQGYQGGVNYEPG